MSVIGPSLGLHDDTYVISMEGDVLGRACDSAPGPHRQHARVLEVKIHGKIHLHFHMCMLDTFCLAKPDTIGACKSVLKIVTRQVRKEFVESLGYPDFGEVRYGLTSAGGEVFAAQLQAGGMLQELVYPHVHNFAGDDSPHPKAGQAKLVGKLALRKQSKNQACRHVHTFCLPPGDLCGSLSTC